MFKTLLKKKEVMQSIFEMVTSYNPIRFLYNFLIDFDVFFVTVTYIIFCFENHYCRTIICKSNNMIIQYFFYGDDTIYVSFTKLWDRFALDTLGMHL